MLHDGAVVWRMNSQRQIDVHLVLLEDLIVILQREGGKYVLRAESSALTSASARNTSSYADYQKYQHSSIVSLKGLLTRDHAAGM